MARGTVKPTMTLDEAFAAAVTTSGDTSVTGDGERTTLAELAGRVDAVARGLRAAGVEHGDPVALLLPNGVRYVEAFFGVLRAGAVAVPLDVGLSPDEIAAVSRVVPLRAVIGERPHPGAAALDVTPAGPGWSLPPGGVLPDVPARRRDPAAVFFTTGTTGDPKPVRLTHHDLVRPLVALERLHAAFFSGSMLDTARRVATVASRHGTRLLRASGRQTWLTVSPFRSIAGHQVLTGSLLLGHDLVTSRSFHPRRVLELVDTHRVNVLAGTPAVLELLLRVPDLAPHDLSSLLVIGVGGGPASPDLVDRARARFGCAVTVGYGSTELGGGVLATRLEDPLDTQAQTVGRPFPGTEVRVLDESGAEVPVGEPGELACRRSDEDPDADPDTGDPDDTGGKWVRTGDLAVRDARGDVRILGRKDDLIVRGGQNLHPQEVERVVERLDGVASCAVVGVPVRGDQQAWAYVRPADGQHVTAEQVRAQCRASLAPYKQPDRVRLVAALPVAESGEVRKRVLREQALAELAGAPTAHEETGR